MKRHTADHLHDRAWPYGAARKPAPAAPTPPPHPQEGHYLSGNFPGQMLVDVQLKYGSTGRPEHRFVPTRS
ncbi:MAG: hypothetical protein JWM51_336 [Microbacteriaceae bacterium]|jgi:hypothetical protein|nr:hypothetical protein [Microbacteriaceae bacterium]